MLTTNNLILELRAKERKLYSPEVQLLMEKESDEVKQNFLKQRTEVGDKLHMLEIQDLEEILKRLKPLEAELDKATKDLDRELQSLNNAVKIISSISAVTRVLARLVMIF